MKQRSLFRVSASEYRQIFSLARPYRRKIFVLATASFLSGSTEATFLVIITKLAIAVSEDRRRVSLIGDWRISIFVGLLIATGFVALRLCLALVSSMLSAALTESTAKDLRTEIAGAFLASSWEVQQNEPSGHLLNLVTGFVDTAVGTISALSNTIATTLNLAAMLLITFLVNPLATLVVVGALSILISVLSPIRSRIKDRARKNAHARKDYSNAVSELGEMGLEMQVFGVTNEFVARIGSMSGSMAKSARRVAQLKTAIPHLFMSLAFIAIILVLYALSLSRAREFSSAGAVMLVLLRSLTFGQQLQNSSGTLAASSPFLGELISTRKRYFDNASTQGTLVIDEIGRIEVDEVSFSYDGDRDALVNLSFDIEPGEIVGIIGPSGSGKSTLVQLLLGLREPRSGSIRVNGVPLREIERGSWSKMVAFVPQDAHLITGTVAENIRFFRKGIDDASLERAARLANILDDIESFPEEFQAHLGQRGIQMSGGQRQRMSIARALAAHPKLLILDEPTSALDVRSELLIRNTVADLRGDVTVIVIAHRLSTLDMCDRLMVIEDGHLVAFDTPERLRSDSQFYQQALAISGLA